MPHCQNCGGWVSPSYARVFSLPGEDTVRACENPQCDQLRDGAEVRQQRSTGGRTGGEVDT